MRTSEKIPPPPEILLAASGKLSLPERQTTAQQVLSTPPKRPSVPPPSLPSAPPSAPKSAPAPVRLSTSSRPVTGTSSPQTSPKAQRAATAQQGSVASNMNADKKTSSKISLSDVGSSFRTEGAFSKTSSMTSLDGSAALKDGTSGLDDSFNLGSEANDGVGEMGKVPPLHKRTNSTSSGNSIRSSAPKTFENTPFFKPAANNTDQSLRPTSMPPSENQGSNDDLLSESAADEINKMTRLGTSLKGGASELQLTPAASREMSRTSSSLSRDISVEFEGSLYPPNAPLNRESGSFGDITTLPRSLRFKAAESNGSISSAAGAQIAAAINAANKGPKPREARRQLGPFVVSPKRKESMMKVVHEKVYDALEIITTVEKANMTFPPNQEFIILQDPAGAGIKGAPFGALSGPGSQGPPKVPVAPGSKHQVDAVPLQMEMNEGKQEVKFSTLPGLVNLLAYEGQSDLEYMVDFLRTYRYFSDPYDVARLLIIRYVECGEAIWHRNNEGKIKDQKASKEADQWAGFIQLRVLNVFKKWVENHPEDFERNSNLFDIVVHFLQLHVRVDPKRTVHADSIIQNIESKTTRSVFSVQSGFEVGPSAGTITPKTAASFKTALAKAGINDSSLPDVEPVANISIIDLDPEIIAQQLTLIEHTLLKRIRLDEFFAQSWNDKHNKDSMAPNLVAFINWFNKVASGVATEVVREPKIKNRVNLIKRFIFIAHTCIKWNNYNSVFEIVAGLNNSNVSRLKKTWKALPKKYWDVWNSLNVLVSNEGKKKRRKKLFIFYFTITIIFYFFSFNIVDITV